VRIGIVDEPRHAELLQLAIQLGGEHQVAWLVDSEAALAARAGTGGPDLVLLNVDMPSLDGQAATRRLVSAGSAVLVMAAGEADPARVFDAIGHGALDAISLGDAVFPEAIAKVLLPKIASVARWIGKGPAKGTAAATDDRLAGCQRLLVIGASAGGPAALSVVLGGLPRTLPAGIVVVQHLGEDFTVGIAEWLRRSTELDVRVARDGDRPAAGTVLVAGGNDHLIFRAGARLGYTAEPRDKIYRPSIDVFFDSVCRLWRGAAIGVLLTGMGRDGAQGLQALRARGHHTIAQDEATSAVYGMPKAAAALNAAVDILPLDRIAARINEVVTAPVRTRRLTSR
jgi:two-component system, chemotaxis family, response regulator WspF